MKKFETLIEETLHSDDIEELEAAADLFQFGIEKGYYTKRQADEFNTAYWKVKNKCLAYSIADKVNSHNLLDIIDIVANAPAASKDNEDELITYVNARVKAMKGKITGLR